MDLNEVFMIVI